MQTQKQARLMAVLSILVSFTLIDKAEHWYPGDDFGNPILYYDGLDKEVELQKHSSKILVFY
jgi:hypothetical protein